ncbi:AAA family ATPase [Nonomuraea sp. NN258]|nr:AAA family ATPase [Nonomuraea antri]
MSRLISDARKGKGGALLLRGQPGTGKTALLDHAAGQAGDALVLRARGVRTESDLPCAGLHLLLHDVLDRHDLLPEPHHSLLHGALRLNGEVRQGEPNPAALGLALRCLLTGLAAQRPVLCLVDDVHQLDTPSVEALSFAARRMKNTSIALLATADAFPPHRLGPELRLSCLDRAAAVSVLGDHAPAAGDAGLERAVALADGNPLALIHQAQALNGVAQPEAHARRVIAELREGVLTLPEPTRMFLTIVGAMGACAPLGPVLAAARLTGLTPADLEPAERAGLVEIAGDSIVFRHPLTRVAAHDQATLAARSAAHRGLAAVLTGPQRLSHLAASAVGPDEDIAAELERCATSAGDHEHAARLSPSRADRSRRLLLAAQAASGSGRLAQASDLAEKAMLHSPEPSRAAAAAAVRGEAEFNLGRPDRAALSFIAASRLIADADPRHAATMLTASLLSALTATDLALAGEAIQLLRELPGHDPAVASALGGMVDIFRGEVARGCHAIMTFFEDPAAYDHPHAAHLLLLIADVDRAHLLARRFVSEREVEGVYAGTPYARWLLAQTLLLSGRHREAMADAREALRVSGDLGHLDGAIDLRLLVGLLAAFTGEPDVTPVVQGEGASQDYHQWALALHDLRQGRNEHALDRLTAIRHPTIAWYCTGDLVEAAVKSGEPERAAPAVARLEEWAAVTRAPWIAAVAARCRGILTSAEEPFLAALRLDGQVAQPYEHARTLLAFGEWLRRQRRRSEARVHLEKACNIFHDLGTLPWAERAERELAATQGPGPRSLLTPQEQQVVRLAAQGATNSDIAGRLGISSRTVAYHLQKAYPKLGVNSRGELAGLPPTDLRHDHPEDSRE